ncbi:MAG: M48 family metallopeptidase [Bacteroidetes bacterium]|nr:M48 family metallopeptidase [Bacteroidota bacterium]MDA1119412.1 M48 family metallopeptidase [Bacteroidota bacterium]
MIKNVIASLFIALVFLSNGCSKVPVTGRSQLSLVKNSEIIPASFEQYEQVKKESKLSNDAEQVAMVRKVGTRIQTAVEKYMNENGWGKELKGYAWEFNLIEEETVNAWAMPGGKVAFYTGIMPICKDEKGIAVVMGHEVAHAIANHGRERMSQSMAAQYGMASLSVAMGQNPTGTQELLMQSIGAGTQLGMLKFSRTHESEADHLGIIFMAIAGYDPHEAPIFWERMSTQSGGGAPPEFMSTHPSHDTRISDLNKWMAEALKYYQK